MVNKAKSQELKNQINRKEVDDLKAYFNVEDSSSEEEEDEQGREMSVDCDW